MIYILGAALFFMMLSSAVLLRNRFEFKSISDQLSGTQSKVPKVSICVPARNEEKVIERCVRSLLIQDYANYEVLVLDDNSDDNTQNILTLLQTEFDHLKILTGKPKPSDWLGKPWACHQLSENANGEILLFIDADVWLEPFVVSNTVLSLSNADALTIWPEQKLGGFIERLIVPSIMFSLVTLLPAVYVERRPKWMPNFIHEHFKTDFVAACGQFIAIKKSTYDAINGHEGVKNQVVEDMEIGRALKRNDFTLTMRTGIDAVYCRMYTSSAEVWVGFQKNFYPGFGSFFVFMMGAIFHFFFFLYPIYTLFVSLTTDHVLLTFLSGTIIFIYTVQRFVLNLWYKLDWWMAFFHPFAVLWFQILGLKSILNKVFGFKSTWKGRQV